MHHMTYLPTNIYIYRVVPKDHSGPLYKIGNAPSIEEAKPCKNKRKEEADPAVETIHRGRPQGEKKEPSWEPMPAAARWGTERAGAPQRDTRGNQTVVPSKQRKNTKGKIAA